MAVREGMCEKLEELRGKYECVELDDCEANMDVTCSSSFSVIITSVQ